MSHNFVEQIQEETSKLRKIWVWVVLVFVLLGIVSVGIVAYASTYENRVLPGVHIGSIMVGGMERAELTEYLHTMQDKLSKEGISFSFDAEGKNNEFTIYPGIIEDENIVDLVYIDIDNEVERLLTYQKEGNPLTRALSTGFSRVWGPRLELENVVLNTEVLSSSLEEKLEPYQTPPKDAGIRIDSIVPVTYTLTTSSVGTVFDLSKTNEQIIESWSVLGSPEIGISVATEHPTLKIEDIEPVTNRIESFIDQGSLDVAYTDAHSKRDYVWKITTKKISEWIEPQWKDVDDLALGLNKEKVISFLEQNATPQVNREPKSAKFKVGSGGKVKEFQGSRTGVSIDLDETYNKINLAMQERVLHDEGVSREVSIVTEQVEPEVRTGEVNDLGINEVLGVGYSNFSGSPHNRIKNISFAVNQKLNGLLIKPDEEFSLLNALKPFTIEGGYLPELVIKGDEIKPEVAGGLCQIGSTMFRAAMNSGLKITQRRNHSLVVNYYNDHRNGLPGTDATIYDPAPDLRFKNDTGNYILLTTEIDMAKKDIYFTLWGTSDGREGYYSEPVVTKWLPTGPTKTVETTTIAPGKQKCQS